MKIIILIIGILGMLILVGCNNNSLSQQDNQIISDSPIEVTLKSNPGHNGFEGAYDFSNQKVSKIYLPSSFSDYKDYDLVYYDKMFNFKYIDDHSGNTMVLNIQIDMGEKTMDEVTCPIEIVGYDYMKPMKIGHTYCMRTKEGDYVKLYVLSVVEERTNDPIAPNSVVTFEWEKMEV
ncbi:MAG: hypothetical protein ABII01_06645 [Candidatus Woesearchaeota archaeon]